MSKVVRITDHYRERYEKVLLSNRQYAALRLFTTEAEGYHMDARSALNVDQRSFGSLFHRKYIKWDNACHGFVLTPEGRRAQMMFENTTVMKDTPSRDYSHYVRVVRALRRVV